MEIEVRYSRRRTLSVSIDKRTGEIKVAVPIGTPRSTIENFIKANIGWVNKTQAKIMANLHKFDNIGFENGKYLMFMGDKCEVCLVNGLKKVSVTEDVIYLPKDNPEEAYKSFLKEYLKPLVAGIAEEYGELMDVTPKSIAVTGAKTRWGSCSAKNAINFSFRLCMTPKFFIEYVVVHELAHIVYKNHSREFYDFIQEHFSNLKAAKRWEKANAGIMSLI